MVAMDPNDPESVERASAILRMHSHEFASTIRSSIYSTWLQLKDVDGVESRYRNFLDRALYDFRSDPDAYMASIDMGRQMPISGSFDDANTDAEELQIRIAVYIYWIGLPPERRNHEALEVEIRTVLDDALSRIRDDPDSFGSEFHWTSS